MQTINSDQEYKLTLKLIDKLLAKGSQGITSAEMSEITQLRRLASEYEVLRYDHGRTQQDLKTA